MICCSISSHRLSCLACNPASFLLRVRCSYLGLRFWEEALAILNSHGVTTYIVEEKFEEWIQDPVIQASLVVQWLRIHLPMQGHGFEPWSGKIPHATEQLSLCTTITESVL